MSNKRALPPDREGQFVKDANYIQLQPLSDEGRSALEQSDDADSLLKAIAKEISRIDAIESLGKELGFTVAEIQDFIKTNSRHHQITNHGTLSMLRKWSDGVSPSSLPSNLREALQRAGLIRIADTYLNLGSAHISPSLTEEQVQECTKELKEYYRMSRRTVTVDPLNFMKRAKLDEIYTNLIIIDHSGMRKTPMTYEDLLGNDESGHLSKRILIQGEGGVGKTTLCSKIAWDWSQGRILQDVHMVLVIPLRDVKNEKSIGGIVKKYLSDSNSATANQIDDYISTHPSKCIIVFDGFDEFNGKLEEKSSSQVIRILGFEQYKSCKVIVTTRPWRRHDFTMAKRLAEAYMFISVEGFNKDNLRHYIKRYFVTGENDALAESLISFMEENDVIRTNMAPFPIYCAMLCLMWSDYSEERRKKMAKMQTFAELFGAIISFLKEHYASKLCEHLESQKAAEHFKEANRAIQDISEIALNGLFHMNLSFPAEQFKDCNDAMEMCCRVGVLTIEREVITGERRRDANIPSFVESTVSFPHKLFQEYVAGLYIEDIFVNDRAKYEELKHELISRLEEFRYVLYFASALRKGLGLDIITSVYNYLEYCHLDESDVNDFCVDLAFECHTEKAARAVGEQLEKYELSEHTSHHTNAGVVFMMHNNQARSLSIDRVNCGRTLSRDLAEGMCSSPLLRIVTIIDTRFHTDFYKIIGDKASTCQIQDLTLSFYNWNGGSQHRSPQGKNLAKWVFKIPRLTKFSLECPYLDGDFLSAAAASPSSCQIQDLTLTFDAWNDDSQHRSLPGSDLAQWVFTMPSLSRFSLTCPYLDVDFLSTAATSASSCQIQDLNLRVDSWRDSSQAHSSLGGNLAQRIFSIPSLSNFSLWCPYLDGNFLSTAASSASSYQIKKLTLIISDPPLDKDASSVGKGLAQWVCTMPHLSSFSMECLFYFPEDDFFSTAAKLERSCQIRKLSMKFNFVWRANSAAAAAAAEDFADFLCHLPHLECAKIECSDLPETFFTKIAPQKASCKIGNIIINGKPLNALLSDE